MCDSPRPPRALATCVCAQVVDVGGGTGFCTQGILAAGVKPTNITLLDQSPQQLAKARAKPDLSGVTIVEARAGLLRGWVRTCMGSTARGRRERQLS